MNSQTQLILKELQKKGVVSNLWALNNGIWRLGARIHDLRNSGYEIVTMYKNKKGERNCKYKLVV